MTTSMTVYYDGSCPFCTAEINALRETADAEALIYSDCSPVGFADEFTTAAGISREALMNELHLRNAAGQWYRGVAAFEQLYRQAGLPQIARFWAHPLASRVASRVYPWIARNRYWLSKLGLPGLTETVIRFYAKRAGRRSRQCSAGHCSLHE